MIRGETDHYDFVCAEAAAGIARVSLDTGVPCAFGVLTVDNMDQALARTGGGKRHQGEDAAHAVLRMAELRRQLADVTGQPPQRHPDAAQRRACATPSPRRRWATSRRRLDPTTIELQERVAELLGHEAGLFLPSGSMCNLIAFRLHIRPGGDEAILAANSHPAGFEAGAPAAVNGAMLRLLDTPTGIFGAGRRGGRPAHARRPLRAALADGVGRAEHEHGRRARVAAVARCATCWTWPAPPACAPTWTVPG